MPEKACDRRAPDRQTTSPAMYMSSNNIAVKHIVKQHRRQTTSPATTSPPPPRTTAAIASRQAQLLPQTGHFQRSVSFLRLTFHRSMTFDECNCTHCSDSSISWSANRLNRITSFVVEFFLGPEFHRRRRSGASCRVARRSGASCRVVY